MYILGLHNAADSGVCLFKDNVILEAISEERLNRKKLFLGPPEESLRFVLGRHKLTLGDIDQFVYGWYGKQNDYADYAKRLTARTILALSNDPSCGADISDRVGTEFDRDEIVLQNWKSWCASVGIPEEKISYVDHHTSHAWAAFTASPFAEAFVFTFDGRGDLKSASASFASDAEGLVEADYLLSFDSLGYLYGQITGYLGYTPHRHEGKVTGLAAHGDAEQTLPLFEKLLRWDDGAIVANLGPYRPFYSNLTAELTAELDKFSPEDIAAGLQRHCEILVTKYVAHWIKQIDRPNVKNICLSGGLFANVKINQCVLELDGIENVYVFPHMGDGGIPFGSAAYWNYTQGGAAKVALPSVYLGNSYDDDEILTCLKEHPGVIRFGRMSEKITEVVDLLVNEKVVGYFDGRMEYGPRALGARSILYGSKDASVNDWLNKRLKRTEFMPFAPVTPIEYAKDCYVGWQEDHICAQFMTITYACTEDFIARHKAVVHVDGTARPQIVTEEIGGDYYKIVKSYCDRTGDKALINTSFNQHEEPIVCSPTNAIESLLADNIDVLVIGDYCVFKQ